jgi:hypothetical protein
LNAFQYAHEHLCEPVTVEFYKQLNTIACAHFRGKENNTAMNWLDAGTFRNDFSDPVQASFSVEDILSIFLEQTKVIADQSKLLKEFKFVRVYANNRTYTIERHIEDLKEINLISLIDEDTFTKLDSILQTKFKELQSELEKFSKKPGCNEKAPTIILSGASLSMHYTRERLDDVIPQLFSTFNQDMQKITDEAGTSQTLLQDKKLQLIADLYQHLEWLHPYRDGQGRTDLILLSKLLTEYGFTPAILIEPYVSSFVIPTSWFQYLKEGIGKWKEAKDVLPIQESEKKSRSIRLTCTNSLWKRTF